MSARHGRAVQTHRVHYQGSENVDVATKIDRITIELAFRISVKAQHFLSPVHRASSCVAPRRADRIRAPDVRHQAGKAWQAGATALHQSLLEQERMSACLAGANLP